MAGQAVLSLVDAANNGIGSDAMLLVYDARQGKAISINAEGTAPALATIEWYRAHQGGKLPNGDTLLSGTVPGVVDAWYHLLDRWGSMSFAQVLEPAIEMAEEGFPWIAGWLRPFRIEEIAQVSVQREGVLCRRQGVEERRGFHSFPTWR